MTTLRRFIGLTGTLVLMVTLAPLLGSTTVASAGSPLGGISRSSSTTPNLSPQRNAPTLIGTRQASQTVIISRTDSGYYWGSTPKPPVFLTRSLRTAHVADEHVRKTPEAVFTYDTSKRQGFPHTFPWTTATRSASATRLSPNTCFPTPRDWST